jgi:hypothetical protein
MKEEIQKFILKYKNSKDLNKAYLEFELSWLKYFDKKKINEVLYNFDCVRDDRILEDKNILNNFIKSLENLLTN